MVSEKLKIHYEIEKELATKLRNATKDERRQLYSALYNELYQRVPFHPQLTRKYSPLETKKAVRLQMVFLRRFLSQNITFLEIGPGDCALSIEVAKFVKRVFAVDVSVEIVKGLTTPSNFCRVLFDGVRIPVRTNSINVAYSHQLMEHLHPDDAYEQLKNIYDSLAPGGIYLCITPNRIDGPHDISRFFDEVATGFHLKEYNTREVRKLYRKVGFKKVRVYIGGKGKFKSIPSLLVVVCETILETIPHHLRRTIIKFMPFRLLVATRFVGIK